MQLPVRTVDFRFAIRSTWVASGGRQATPHRPDHGRAPRGATAAADCAGAAVAVSGLADPMTQLEQYRGELTRHAYAILGSPFEAEDAVQETLVRAWRAYGRFEGRSSLRTWLYRIATNVCLDMLAASERRAQPMDVAQADAGSQHGVGPDAVRTERTPAVAVAADSRDPADIALAREAVRWGLVSAFAKLPPRQRAVLILRDVLRWRADEVARLLDTSVAAVNSALQRARATVTASRSTTAAAGASGEIDAVEYEILTRYVEAFERQDVDTLTALLRDDATRPSARA